MEPIPINEVPDKEYYESKKDYDDFSEECKKEYDGRKVDNDIMGENNDDKEECEQDKNSNKDNDFLKENKNQEDKNLLFGDIFDDMNKNNNWPNSEENSFFKYSKFIIHNTNYDNSKKTIEKSIDKNNETKKDSSEQLNDSSSDNFSIQTHLIYSINRMFLPRPKDLDSNQSYRCFNKKENIECMDNNCEDKAFESSKSKMSNKEKPMNSNIILDNYNNKEVKELNNISFKEREGLSYTGKKRNRSSNNDMDNNLDKDNYLNINDTNTSTNKSDSLSNKSSNEKKKKQMFNVSKGNEKLESKKKGSQKKEKDKSGVRNDTLIKTVKTRVLNYFRDTINDELKNIIKEEKLKKELKKEFQTLENIQLFQLKQNFNQDTTIKFNLDILNDSFRIIYSNENSERPNNALGHNKKLIDKIYEIYNSEEEEQNRKKTENIVKILNLKFKEFFDILKNIYVEDEEDNEDKKADKEVKETDKDVKDDQDDKENYIEKKIKQFIFKVKEDYSKKGEEKYKAFKDALINFPNFPSLSKGKK